MKILVSILSVFFLGTAAAQVSGERYEVSAAGGDAIAISGHHVSYTVGGLIVNTATPNNYVVTQGFEQPDNGEGGFNNVVILNNAFSPDGDGVNDFWVVDLPSNLIGVVDLTILNRWGDQVAYVEDYDNVLNVWDGNYQATGKPVVEGTYFYIFESPETGQKKTGWVQVVRNN
jgi:gliding motility-associated-like protein